MSRNAPFAAAWRRVRLAGFLDPGQALETAAALLAGAGPDQPRRLLLAGALLRQAAVFLPFDPALAAQARRLFPAAPPPPGFEAWLAGIAAAPDLAATLARALHAWQTGQREAFLTEASALLAAPGGTAAGPLLAWGLRAAGEPAQAAQVLDQSPENFLSRTLRGRLALDQGRPDQARDALLAALDLEPCQPGTLLQLAELLAPAAPPRNPAVHVCLYSWNKSRILARTLASLAATDLRGARVTLLNNGSTDLAPADLEAQARNAAPGLDLEVLHLPGNVGAPAARNWLLSLPASRRASHVAFLDDDVLLPRAWLASLLQALESDPRACVAGVKVLHPRSPLTLQYAWRFFAETGERRIRFTANAPTLLDLGQYDHVRPCLSVMGCCHLLHRERLDRLGAPGFDVRFSPSQVDDIEHDLQVWKAGGRVLFDGRAGVVHLQDTGDLARRTRLAAAQAHANHFKMEHKFEAAELAAMDRAVDAADALALRAALEIVLPDLPPAARAFWTALAPALP
jgi:GT2 family glycosyltransferase